jgi:hypothetical protein
MHTPEEADASQIERSKFKRTIDLMKSRLA